MISIKVIREEKDFVIKSLNKRGGNYDVAIEEILTLDSECKKLNQDFELQRSNQKKLSQEFASQKNVNKDELQTLSQNVKSLSNNVSKKKEELEKLLLALPNIPDEDIISGGKENNKVIAEFGSIANPTFKIKDHYTICKALGLIDYDRGAKIAGSGNWLYWDKGALLEWALLNFFISEHAIDNYKFILPPHLLTYESGIGAGQFPKFVNDVFMLEQEGNERKFLLPTSETALVNIYRDEIMDESMLPLKLFSYTPCYRKEAGGYGNEEKGTIRGHQFNKVEMFHFAHPDNWKESFDELVEKASDLVKKLGLHHRVTKLAAGDVSASMKRTYDIEVYIPSYGYKEVSSVSNAGSYQAIRANIRFKNSSKDKLDFVYTLNGSGLATSRLLVAIVEQFQDDKGGIVVPEVLRKWIGMDYIPSK